MTIATPARDVAAYAASGQKSRPVKTKCVSHRVRRGKCTLRSLRGRRWRRLKTHLDSHTPAFRMMFSDVGRKQKAWGLRITRDKARSKNIAHARRTLRREKSRPPSWRNNRSFCHFSTVSSSGLDFCTGVVTAVSSAFIRTTACASEPGFVTKFQHFQTISA